MSWGSSRLEGSEVHLRRTVQKEGVSDERMLQRAGKGGIEETFVSNLKPRGCIFCDCSCGSGAAGHRSWGDLGLLRYHEKIN